VAQSEPLWISIESTEGDVAFVSPQ
jgi:hypothetical protein